MIRCAQCGRENRLGHIFCTHCRAKLDTSSLAPEVLHPQNPTIKRWKIMVSALIILTAVGLGLMLAPVRVTGDQGAVADLQQARRKVMLIEQNRSSGPQVFTEREINAYLTAVLDRVRWSQKSPPPLDIRSLGMTIKPQAVMVTSISRWGPLKLGAITLGPLRISHTVKGVPESTGTGIRWAITGGRLGHLPLPGPLGRLAAAPWRTIVAQISREQSLMDRVSRLELAEGQLTVFINP